MPRIVTKTKAQAVRKTAVTGRGMARQGVIQKPATDQTAQKAFELFEQRGRQHGHDQDDWFRAERMLGGKK